MHFKSSMWLNALLVRILDQMLGNLMTHDLSQPVLEAIIIYEQVVSHPVVLFFNQVLKSPILAFSWRKRKKQSGMFCPMIILPNLAGDVKLDEIVPLQKEGMSTLKVKASSFVTDSFWIWSYCLFFLWSSFCFTCVLQMLLCFFFHFVHFCTAARKAWVLDGTRITKMQ